MSLPARTDATSSRWDKRVERPFVVVRGVGVGRAEQASMYLDVCNHISFSSTTHIPADTRSVRAWPLVYVRTPEADSVFDKRFDVALSSWSRRIQLGLVLERLRATVPEGASISEPEEIIYKEDAETPELRMLSVHVVLPTADAEEADRFRRELYDWMSDHLSTDGLTSLALYVLPQET